MPAVQDLFAHHSSENMTRLFALFTVVFVGLVFAQQLLIYKIIDQRDSIMMAATEFLWQTSKTHNDLLDCVKRSDLDGKRVDALMRTVEEICR